jgi:tRNA threonylcarbamoyladenosine biosynthesis protein TsaE
MARVVPDAADARLTASPEATEALGAALAPALGVGDLVLLIGRLGAGKTRFVVGLARGLGARGRVRSPAFTLVHEYAGGRALLFHLDLYRLESHETTGLGLEEMRERGILVVEWGDRLPAAVRTEALELTFTPEGESHRSIAARGDGTRGLELLEHWRAIPAGWGT